MPIEPSLLQRRHWQDGRIRIGTSKPTPDGNKQPLSLSTFRFTSASLRFITAIAERYGGTVNPWQWADGPQHEVITKANQLPVILPPFPITQFMELWDGPNCARRCTGKQELLTKRSCLCGPDLDLRQRTCKPTTRMSVLLRDIPSLGLWRLDTKGFTAAEILPGAAEFLARVGDYVDGVITVTRMNRTIMGQQRSYVVPGLIVESADDQLTPGRLLAGQAINRYQFSAHSPAPAITTGTAPGAPDYIAMAATTTSAEEIKAIYKRARDAGHLTETLRTVLNALGQARSHNIQAELTTSGTRAGRASVAAETEEAERLRSRILTAWPGTMTELHQQFHNQHGTTLKQASLAQLTAFAALTARTNPSHVDEMPPDVVNGDLIDDQP
ncbi:MULTISPECIES: hypothetical protein [unclassified Nonomuraea]|uniref:recombination directionality factor n=1 Tax=unclassified Nonomuraea TaxID=2593643 RepID=UPI0033F1C30C